MNTNDMKIFWTFCIYNELELLPYKIDFMGQNAIDFFVFDNMSTDGSWEWLQKNRIPSERFDSDGMFNLKTNMPLLNEKIHNVKPDWAMMGGTDMFYVHLTKTLREVIESADKGGFNCIHDCYKSFQFMFTEEEAPGRDPRLTYMYYAPMPLNTVCIAKYSNSLRLQQADYFNVRDPKPWKDEKFVMLHYSMRHDGKKRKTEQYNRRKMAWDAGHTDRDYGAHYKRIIEKNQFVFDKRSLRDIRGSAFWEPIKKSAEKKS